MKWKNDVTLEKKKEQYFICIENSKKQVETEDTFICEAVEQGITDETELISLIMDKEQKNDVLASLRLAQFVLDYSEFVSNETGHMGIEP